MRQLLFILFLAVPLVAMEQNQLTPYQQQKLDLKKRKLALEELALLTQNSEFISIYYDEQASCLYNAFVASKIFELFSKQYNNVSPEEQASIRNMASSLKSQAQQSNGIEPLFVAENPYHSDSNYFNTELYDK